MSEPNPQTLERFWLALGKFVHRYAEVEEVMHEVLRVVSNTSITNAQAIFSGTRVRTSMDHIRRIYEGRNQPLDPWLARAFPRLGEITTVRDRMLHYGLDIKSKKRALVTDRHRVLRHKVKTFPISISDLDALEEDINTIHSCLTVFWIEQRWPSFDPERTQSAREHAMKPWQYKLPQPIQLKPNRPGNNQAHSPPPQS